MGNKFKSENLGPILIAGIGVILAAFAGLPEALGAHPFWAVRVGLYGAPAALVLWLVLRAFGLKSATILVLSVIVLIGAILSHNFGKQPFVSSYARDGLAGRFWYVGWIVAMGAITTILAAIIARFWPRRK